jgi:hypothetical protein
MIALDSEPLAVAVFGNLCLGRSEVAFGYQLFAFGPLTRLP